MVNVVNGQLLSEASQHGNLNLITSAKGDKNYVATLQPAQAAHTTLPLKPLMYLNSQPRVIWMEDEISHITMNEELKYIIIGKNLNGWQDIQKLHKLILK